MTSRDTDLPKVMKQSASSEGTDNAARFSHEACTNSTFRVRGLQFSIKAQRSTMRERTSLPLTPEVIGITP